MDIVCVVYFTMNIEILKVDVTWLELCLISKHQVNRLGYFRIWGVSIIFLFLFSSKIFWVLIYFFLWMIHDLWCKIPMAISPSLSTTQCANFCCQTQISEQRNWALAEFSGEELLPRDFDTTQHLPT